MWFRCFWGTLWTGCFFLLLQLIELHPVHLHAYGVFCRIGLAHPAAFNLHVDEQIVRSAERILPLFVRFNARIGECMATVDGEHDAVRQNLHGIYVIVIRINPADEQCIFTAVGGMKMILVQVLRL